MSRSFHGETGDRRDESGSPQLTREYSGQTKSSPTQQRRYNETRSDTQQFPWSQVIFKKIRLFLFLPTENIYDDDSVSGSPVRSSTNTEAVTVNG